MKGVILHGGAGTRLRPLTFSGPKQLIPVANKPVSQYVLEDLVSSNVREIAIILGETFPEMVREYYGDGSAFGARLTYIYQGKPLGIAHAVGLCKDFVGDDMFVVYLGDNILQNGIRQYLEEFSKWNYDAMILLKEVEDPRSFGVAEFDERGKLVRLVEKPKIPPSKYALVGVYFFKPVVFDIIRELKPSWRGELEITETIQIMLERGYNVGYRILNGWWFDTGKVDDILTVNAKILDERAKEKVDGKVEGSKIEGRVEVGENTIIVNSIVRGPSVIGRDCLIENSYVGPYTSIGKGSKIVDSSVEYCVILEGVSIVGVERVEESLIGRYAKVRRGEGNSKTLKLNVGDYSEVIL
ncbi:MAG: glucose-1-phosphate thymidylyltransferase [Candidatus Verstraetearchaeota archaeon]|nr:glucose-1-phosphate thymidylyltransferase [Candidatus Verstraetearchaeota archaeon]